MASNKPLRVGPIALTNAAADLLNPPGTTGGVNAAGSPYAIVRHIRVVNKTGAGVTVSLFIGATGASAAGTEFAWSGTTVPANSFLDWYGVLRLDPNTFLTGLASANTSLTIDIEGELGIG